MCFHYNGIHFEDVGDMDSVSKKWWRLKKNRGYEMSIFISTDKKNRKQQQRHGDAMSSDPAMNLVCIKSSNASAWRKSIESRAILNTGSYI